MLKRLWTAMWRPSARYSLAFLMMFGFVAGVIFWGGFNTFMEYTNRLEFCISCHEMRDTVYEEYKKTVHFSNPSGVQAICSDCHVPKEWVAKFVRKVKATNELYHKAVGTIGTPEKFEAKRLEMARRVWAEMEANDSLECRNCHAEHAMQFDKQDPKGATIMKKGFAKGETCISCHKGIAHKLPDMSRGYLVMFEGLKALSTKDNSGADKLYTIETRPYYVERDAAAAGGKGDGQLLAATELAVLERDGDLVKVRIDGWQQDQVDRLIYALQGHRIFSATLGKSIVDHVQRLETMVDPDTELTWHRVSMEAWVANESLIADQAKLWEYGAEMYNASCGTCHSLPPADHYLANQWLGTLKAMKRFMVLDKEQYRFLQKYLQFHSKDTNGADGHG